MDTFFARPSNIKPVGVNINQQARIVINNVLTFICEIKKSPAKLKELNFNQTRELTAKICGVSLRTIDNIKKECANGDPSCPRQHINKPCPVTNLDDFEKSVIRQIVSSFYISGECPSIPKILDKAKEQIENFQCSRSSMRNILKDLGYKYKTTPDGRKQLMETCRKEGKNDWPKSPMSAYMIWLKSAREQIKSENPDLNVPEISKKESEIWSRMEDKSVWEKKAAEAKEQYTKDFRSYYYNGNGRGSEGSVTKPQKRGKKGKKSPAPKSKKIKKEQSDEEDGDLLIQIVSEDQEDKEGEV